MFWTKPRFKRHFRVEVVEAEKAVFLLAEKEHYVLKGDAYAAMAPLLNGQNSPDDIIAALNGRVAAATVWRALMELEKKGYITEERDGLDPAQAAFWSAQGVDPGRAQERLAGTKVMVRALGGLSPAPLAALLESAGLTVADEGGIMVVLTDDYLREELAGINREAEEKGIPWLPVKPVGLETFVGPLFVSGKTACWECLAARLKGNIQVVEQAVGLMQGHVTVIPSTGGCFPPGKQATLSLAALELAKWVVRGENKHLEENLLTVDLVNPGMQAHPVQRLPQCPSCGEPDLAETRPPELQSRLKKFTVDGGHRVLRPEETYQKYEHLVDPLTGLVSQVKRERPENSRIHLYFSGRNRALDNSRYNLKRLKTCLRSNSAGKGMTDAQARSSALCEALERISGVFRGDEPLRKACYRQLGEDAVHPDACQHFSDSQYRQREKINRQEIKFYYIPEPFDEDAVIDWTPVWSLTQKRFRYLPAEYCYFSYPYPRFAVGDANGNASGNTLEEAVMHGFFELVERDGAALWWYNRLQFPGVDIDSFAEPYYAELRDEYGRMGRKMWALDLTSDLGIPTFTAVSCRADGTGSQILFGFGTHLDPKIALARAVTEMNQSLSILELIKTGDFPLEDTVTLNWLREANLDNQPYLAPAGTAPVKKLADYRQPFHRDILEDIEYCRGIVEKLGLEMLALDQTRPDIGLPTVKVIVPGLRHLWARFAPGRLYDVPVKLGWLKTPKTEDEMNPIPMFF